MFSFGRCKYYISWFSQLSFPFLLDLTIARYSQSLVDRFETIKVSAKFFSEDKERGFEAKVCRLYPYYYKADL